MRKQITRTWTVALAAVVGLMVTIPAAHADVLVYEPFNYAPRSDVNTPLKSGMGFSGVWTAGQQGGAITVYDETAATLVNGNAGGELTWNGEINNVPTLPAVGSRFIGTDTSVDRITAERILSQSADALAGADNALWACVVWHQQGNNSGRHVGFVLGTDGLSKRSLSCDTSGNHGAGLGDAMGVGGAVNTGDVTPAIFDNGTVAVRTTTGASTVSHTEDNLVVLKFIFADGATPDAVAAYRFIESDALSEATFNVNAISATYVLDQDTLNIVSFSQSRGQEAIDETRMGSSFDDVISDTALPEGTLFIIK